MNLRSAFIAVLLLVSAPPAPRADEANPVGDAYCANVLLNEHPLSLRFEKTAVDTVLAKRKIGGVDEQPVVFTVKGHRYDKVSVLGTSSARAYLALDENGEYVVVKKDWPVYSKDGTVETYQDEDWLMHYDELVAEYYRESGIDVPRVIAVDAVHHLEVKDYEEGLTVDDLETSRFASDPILKKFPEEYRILDELLDAEIARVREVHKGFRAWLVAHKPPVSKDFMSEAERLIDRGDMKRGNFLFSLKKQKWILFDP